MRQQLDFIPKKNAFKKTLGSCLLMTFMLFSEKVLGDGTFFPEDGEETATDKLSKEDPSPMKEWAELKPDKKKPQHLTKVKPHPKALPVQETEQVSSSSKLPSVSQKPAIPYSDAANGRTPLGIIDPSQEIQNQRWYIYSTAIRGLKNPSDSVQILSMGGTPPQRGEEVKSLLVEMGIETEKIHLSHATGEENQAGIIYIFAGK